MSMKYRKNPVVIEAFQWMGDEDAPEQEWPAWIASRSDFSILFDDTIAIETLEGQMVAEKGDWIIRGVKGELYPCKPDIFEMTYEAVGEECKHTPGPWAASFGDSVNPAVIGGEPEEMVATVLRKVLRPEMSTADTHLIAAAPDMLAALKEINRRPVEYAKAISRAAIDKAEGKT